MKKLLSFILPLLITTSIYSQKVINDPNVEKRSVGSFHGIDVGTGIELQLTEGTTEEVAVSASSAEYRDKIITKVENGILKIHYESKWGSINKGREYKNLKAYVSYKMLDHLDANTGAEVTINGVLKSNSLNMNANTGALIDGEVNVGSLKVNQNTGSKITLKGKSGSLEVDGDTGSKFKGEDMITSNCEVSVNTGAQVFINAEKTIQGKANTGGLIRYKGNPNQIDVRTGSGGSVTRI